MGEGQNATKENRRGRAMERMIIGKRKEMIEKGTKLILVRKGIMMGRVRNGIKKQKIIWVYVEKNGMERTLQTMEK